jgi:hypothetical protein
MAIKRSSKPLPGTHIATLLRELLEASTLCAIATVTDRGTAHINTAYFAWAEDFRLVCISQPASGHLVNLRKNRSAAVAVFDSHQAWGIRTEVFRFWLGPRSRTNGFRRCPQHRPSAVSRYRLGRLVAVSLLRSSSSTRQVVRRTPAWCRCLRHGAREKWGRGGVANDRGI